MDVDPVVRPVAIEDTARVRALRLEMLADSPMAFIERLDEAAARPHGQFRERLAERIADPSAAHFIGEADGQIIAQAGAFAMPERPGVSLLYAVYVTPRWRGTGLLDQLLAAVADWSRRGGRPALELEVVTANARAIRAYQRRGFTDTGRRTRHPTTAALTEMVMARAA